MLALDTATLAAKTRGFSEEVNGLGATAAAARLSSRAGRPKPRHAKDGAAILARLADEVGRESHFSSSLKKIFAPRGGPLRPRPALPRQSSASGREIAEKGRLAARRHGR